MIFDTQCKAFSIIWKNRVMFLRYSNFHILSILKVVTSYELLVHEIEYIFLKIS